MTRSVTRFAIALATMIVAVALPFSSAGAGQLAGGHTPTVDPGATLTASRVDPGINNTLRALDRLHSFGYTWTTDAGALKAIRHWQRVNGLEVDGVVGPITLASLGLDAATATVPAVRVAPNPPRTPAPSGDACAEMSSYRQAAGLPEQFDAIGFRESRCDNTVTSSTGCCFGYWQNYLSSHLSSQSAYSDRIINECGVTTVADIRGLSDAQKTAQACVTFVVWSISGMSPWAL